MPFDPVAWINTPRWQASRLGLERMIDLLDRMGRPQDALRFVHMAGTNGKGSTCAYLASILQAAGLRVGLFTSPYILRFEERIRVDGHDITGEELARAVEAVRPHAEAMEAACGDHPTEFELMAAVALEHFRATSSCWRWGLAAGWMLRTLSTRPRRASSAASGSTTPIFWGTRWRPSRGRRPAS